MSLCRYLLRPSSLKPLLRPLARPFAFSSAEEAAAERRRRKRRLRIEPPLHALRRDPSAPRPPPDPNAPRLPDSTSSLVGPRLNLHNRVQSLIRSHDLDSASSVARHAVFSSTRPTVFTCNAVVAAMYRTSRYDDAVALFHFFFEQSRIVPNVVSYNFLIVTLCDSGRVDDALGVYRRILDSAPFSPSHVTYRHLTRGLVDAGRLPDALTMLREMIARGHGADSLVFNNVIAGCLRREGNLPKALELFDELRERCLVYDGTVVATFMDWYFLQGRSRDAMDAYQDLLDRQFQMTPATCNSLLEVLLRHGRATEAERLFDDMLSRHKPPTFHALNTDTYNIMVNDRFAGGDHEGAVEVFHRTGAKPLTMDVACFNNIIGKLLQNGLLDHARKLFDEMPEKSVNPDVETYRFFVEFCLKEGKVDDALQWFESTVNQEGEKAPKVRINLYNVVYDGLAKVGQLGIAMEIFRKMWEKGVKPDSSSYKILVTASCNEGLLDQVQALVEEMVRIRVACPPELHQLVLEAFDKAGRGEEVGKMFEPPRPVVLPAPRFQPPRPPQAFQQNPNAGAYRPPYSNASNHAYYQNLNSGAHPPPYNVGNQFSHVGGPQPPVQAPGPQGVNVTGPPQFSGPPGPQCVSDVGPPQFSGHQGTCFSSLPPPTQHVAGPQASHLATSHQPPKDASANSQHFAAQPFSSAGPQSANTLPAQYPGGASQVAHMDSQPSYMGHSQAWQGMHSQTSSSLNHTVAPRPPQFSGSQVPPSSFYQGPGSGNHDSQVPPSSFYQASNSGNPEAVGIGTQTSRAINSQAPYSRPPEPWDVRNPQPMHFSSPQSSHFGGPQTSGPASSPPSFPFGSQNGKASQVAPSTGHSPTNRSGSQSFQGVDDARNNGLA